MSRRSPFRIFRTFFLLVGFAAGLAAAPLLLHGQAPAAKSETPSPQAVERMIGEMLKGRAEKQPIAPPTQAHGPFSLPFAYQIQKQLTVRLTGSFGPVAGYKVAYASEAAQKQFGVPGPASAPIFSLQRIPSGTTLRTTDFVSIMLETEVAFTIGKRIDRKIENVDALKPNVRWAHAAFDMSDGRYATTGAKPTPSDQVANGIGAHFFIVGPAMAPQSVNVDELVLKLARDGEAVRESPAKNVMGSPWNSLLWLVNQRVELGERIEPGCVVLTGTAAPAWNAAGEALAGELVGDCGPLGQVRCTIR